MNWVDKLNKHLKTKKDKLIKGIESTKRARDSAPSAMESHSDTSRSQNEKLLNALELELAKFEELISRVPQDISNKNADGIIKEWSYVELKLGKNRLKVCLVPEGLGGEVIDGVRLISTSTPLGNILLNKKNDDEFIFNQQKGEIISIQ